MGAMLAVIVEATFGFYFRSCLCIPPYFYYTMCCAANKIHDDDVADAEVGILINVCWHLKQRGLQQTLLRHHETIYYQY